MRIVRTLALAFGVVFATPKVVTAQFLFGLDAGQRQDKYGTGFNPTGVFGGISLGGVIGGESSKSTAVLLPITGEVKGGSSGAVDAKLSGDMMLRFGPLSVGGGMDLLVPLNTPAIPGTTTQDDIHIAIDQLFGYSGSVKLNLPPLGKTFVQGRYTSYSVALQLYDACDPQFYVGDVQASCQELRAQHNPQFKDGSELRIGAGIVFTGAKTTILRVQAVQQRINYVREKDNANGAYDRVVRYMTLGLVWPFSL